MRVVKIVINFVLIFAISSCASFPENKIKLSDYPEINKEEIKNLDLGYGKVNFKPDHRGFDFATTMLTEMEQQMKANKGTKENNSRSCYVQISAMHSATFPRICIAHYFIAGFTLFTIPYYCQHIFEAKATLIANNPEPTTTNKSTNKSKPDSANHQTNKQQTNNTTSPNQTQPKILKEYYFKDKAHEVWSSIMFLTAFTTVWTFPDMWSNMHTPEDANNKIQQTISEALTRSVIRDASQFSECQKQPNQNTTPTTKTHNQPQPN